MEIVRSLGAFAPPAEGCAVAIGNFDGLHRGHRKILSVLKRRARGRGLPAHVLTFSPHPETFFGPKRILMLQTLEQRLDTLEDLDIDGVVVAAFRRSFAGLTAEDFARKILRTSLHARLVVVGADFRFGRGRKGDLAALARFGKDLGFEVVGVPQLRRRGEVVSSSAIRAHLAAGEIERANDLLGRPYAIEGDVVPGSGRGRSLGFPTANIETPNEIVPRGIFVTNFRDDREGRPSVTNVGIRPTFGRPRLVVETHLLDFDRDVYGKAVWLEFLKKLRDERTFSGSGPLAAQIRRDVAAARRFFVQKRTVWTHGRTP
jgi:riboflavin kinase/FMN adenylyltransferase